MPNHITNRLTIKGTEEQVKDVFDFLKSKEDESKLIDFNSITPMPKWVYGSDPSVLGISREDEDKWGKENTSLAWTRKNWGTKWNAYGQIDSRNTEDTIYFETAWGGVPELMQKIAWIFPNVSVEYSFADEDIGNGNNGEYVFQGHEVLAEEVFEEWSNEAFELCFELVYGGDVPAHIYYDEEKECYDFTDA